MARHEVPARRTGPEGRTTAERQAWVRSRHAAIVLVLMQQGIPIQRAWSMATSVLAHWADETGWGHSEYDYSLGNIRAFASSWDGAYHILADGLDYRAYDSLVEGVRDNLKLAQAPRYLPSWNYLTNTLDGHGWFDQLMHEGWHPWSQRSLDSYDSERRTVEGIVGTEPPFKGALATALVAMLAGIALAFWTEDNWERA